MLRVDQVFWFQKNASSTQKSAIRALGAGQETPTREFSLRDTPWIAREVWSGSAVWIHRLKDLPAEAAIDREHLEACGIKSLAAIPSTGEGAEISALALTSAKPRNWEEEIIAQLSILASVFANVCAKKTVSEAGQASELKFRHLFDDSPIGVALLDSGGRIRMANG